MSIVHVIAAVRRTRSVIEAGVDRISWAAAGSVHAATVGNRSMTRLAKRTSSGPGLKTFLALSICTG
ncbi:MAG: hypothetical protein ACR2LK_10855 [Solirubrobacteraceae bacterium]